MNYGTMELLPRLLFAAELMGLLASVLLLLLGTYVAIDAYRQARRLQARLLEIPSHEELARRVAELGQRAPWHGTEPPGLVLSGGGGKGAYEIGCLEALRDAGLSRFSAIAGTSVGALNAALVAQGDLEAARQVWTTISRSKVLRFLGVKGVLLRAPLLPFYWLRHSRAQRQRVPPSLWEAASVWWRARDLSTSSRRGLAQDRRLLISSAVGGLLNLILISVAVGLYAWSAPELGGPAVPEQWSLIEVGPLEQTSRLSRLLSLAWGAVLFAPGVTLGLALLWFAFVRIDGRLARKQPLASNDPLRRLLAQHLNPTEILRGPPTFATVAALRLVEPEPAPAAADSGSGPTEGLGSEPLSSPAAEAPLGTIARWWQRHVGRATDFSKPGLRGESVATARERAWPSGTISYVADHLLLQRMRPEEIAERILDSASLPEVFPRRVFDGDEWVDGGVADNTPLLPVLRQGAKSVVVVYLDVKQAAADSATRVRTSEQAAAQARPLGGVRALPTPPLPPTKVSLLRIVPSVSLGSMLSGTLNFHPARASQLIRLGYADTVEALESGVVEWQV